MQRARWEGSLQAVVLALAAVSLLVVLLHNRQAACLSLFPRPFTANTARMEERGSL